MSTLPISTGSVSLPISPPPAEPGDIAEHLKLHRPGDHRLVVIVPALNEEQTIGDVLRRIPPRIEGVDQIMAVVVDDGSTDRTAEVAREAGAIVVSHPRRCGVGSAFQTGLRKMFDLGGDLVVNVDGDGQFAPEDIPKLIAPLLAGEADFVTASRFKDPALVPEMPWLKKWGNRQVSRLISFLTGKKFYDVSCGMRAYNRDAAFSLSLMEPFTYTHEAFLNLTSKRMSIVEVPLAVRGERQFGKSRVARNVFWYGLRTLKIIFRFYRDYRPMRFFCGMALFFVLLGAPFLGFCLNNYLQTGSLSPHKWAGFLGSGLWVLAFVAFCMGILGDMLGRQRMFLEEILYHMRSIVTESRRDR